MTTQNFDVPTLHITKGKNRLKEFNGSVYLNDKDEFELEIFNPKKISVLARISINGIEMSNGLVIRPGERVFLDRFINEPRKFKFNTYTVDGDDEQVKKAIEDNGVIEIKFFNEKVNTYILDTIFNYMQITNDCLYNNVLSSNTYSPTYINDTITYTNFDRSFKGIETGKIEKGSSSKTKLEMVNMDFDSFYSLKVSVKILPNSQRPVTYGEIKTFCSNCGIRIKKSTWKFCPSCGENLNN